MLPGGDGSLLHHLLRDANEFSFTSVLANILTYGVTLKQQWSAIEMQHATYLCDLHELL